ncbi:GNAT family N-acetyltransferase [uncultured Corynebacterium sp.]|uniref:N-acetylglutamate synthase, CG3035 family n=1 Tax=uncultured Corynebacterium sp. TaxID=159447 RepID=UPI0025F0FE93|nr:GNAT family N-acetyltransferase [uncultured Corynebacterium sp.]
MDDTSFSGARAGARPPRETGLPFPVSRYTDPVSVRTGVRATVRHLVRGADGHPDRNPDTGRPLVSDVIGVLRSIDPLTVEDAAGTLHRIPVRAVVVLKTLPAAPVRSSDIRAVEAATAAAFPGLEHRNIGGWLARAGDGITERSNSAVPLGPGTGTSPVPLAEIHAFYRSHDLPTRLLLPDRISRPAEPLLGLPGVRRGPEIIVMTRDLGDGDVGPTALPTVPGPPVDLAGRLELRIDDQPDDEWLQLYHFRGEPLPEHALRLLAARLDGALGFARITVDGRTVAVTRGTVTAGGGRYFLGYSAVEVAPAWRRRGLGTLLGTAMLHWGAAQGAAESYLQVIATNLAGRGLYHGLGFSEHHRHRCVLIPDTV